jgi:hypothetical protein
MLESSINYKYFNSNNFIIRIISRKHLYGSSETIRNKFINIYYKLKDSPIINYIINLFKDWMDCF